MDESWVNTRGSNSTQYLIDYNVISTEAARSKLTVCGTNLISAQGSAIWRKELIIWYRSPWNFRPFTSLSAVQLQNNSLEPPILSGQFKIRTPKVSLLPSISQPPQNLSSTEFEAPSAQIHRGLPPSGQTKNPMDYWWNDEFFHNLRWPTTVFI